MLASTLVTVAHAAPTTPDARAEYDRGVEAYKSKNFELAAEALGASYALEPDTETLFAWAQTERKLSHCDKALELYTKLLDSSDLGAENLPEVGMHIESCKAIIGEQNKRPPQPPVDRPPAISKDAPEPNQWWKDPVGGVLVGTGVVGVSLGVVFLVQGINAANDKVHATTYPEYKALYDRATSHGQLAVISGVAGGAFIAAGIIWYATRDHSTAGTVTGWLDATSGGIAIAGGF